MVYFISGHRDLSQAEFNKHYKPTLKYIFMSDKHPRFFVAECEGADTMAQEYLAKKIDKCEVTVFHIGESPRYLASDKFNTIGKFISDSERDGAMTARSDVDIAFIRPGRERSGTAENILRRHLMK